MSKGIIEVTDLFPNSDTDRVRMVERSIEGRRVIETGPNTSNKPSDTEEKSCLKRKREKKAKQDTRYWN